MFIVIDGLDASGKDTQALRLCRTLKKEGKTVFLRTHPSIDSFFGAKARTFLYMRGKGAHVASAFYYALDVLRSVLLYSWQKYDYTIFVRYLMGTAYLPSPAHRIAYHFFALIVPKSDFMFFLDVAPEEADRRIRQTRDQLEMFESVEELERIRKKALSLALLGKWTIVDGGKPVKEVEKRISEALKPVFQKLEL